MDVCPGRETGIQRECLRDIVVSPVDIVIFLEEVKLAACLEECLDGGARRNDCFIHSSGRCITSLKHAGEQAWLIGCFRDAGSGLQGWIAPVLIHLIAVLEVFGGGAWHQIAV